MPVLLEVILFQEFVRQRDIKFLNLPREKNTTVTPINILQLCVSGAKEEKSEEKSREADLVEATEYREAKEEDSEWKGDLGKLLKSNTDYIEVYPLMSIFQGSDEI